MIRVMAVAYSYYFIAALTVFFSFVFTKVIRKAFSRFRSRENKAGKELIYRHFPKHKKPLGGGMAVFAALIVGMLVALCFHLVTPTLWIWLSCGLAFGAIGFIDDWQKVNSAKGLGEAPKLLLQIALALVFTLLIVTFSRNLHGHPPNALYLPFLGWLTVPWLIIPAGVLVIVGASNAVNLTDGLDGLAGSGLAFAFAGYLVLGAMLHQPNTPAIIPLLALASLVGFLVYNRPPARIIMGDTGALGLGASLGALALLSGTEWLLLLFAAPFVIDTASVIIQVSVIKFFRGPIKLLRHQRTEIFRPFLCTPLHHHFQWLTWNPWPILALFNSMAVLSGLLGILAFAVGNKIGSSWLWLFGIALQGCFLLFAALQKVVRANYFLGLERTDEHEEPMLTLCKGLPLEVLGVRWYALEEVTGISEGMLNSIAAESILWRNISEIEARATLGKIYAEYKMFDRAAEEWEEIPLRNLLIRENLVVQLGKIYFSREELLRAIKLWEQLPSARLARVTGLPETIQSAKVRVGHLAGRLYHQALEHVTAMRRRVERGHPALITQSEITALIEELEGALQYMQDLRDLLAYEQQKAEREEPDAQDAGLDLYRRMDMTLTTRRDELHQDLRWAQQLIEPDATADGKSPLRQLAESLQMTPAEISRALEVPSPLAINSFHAIHKPSRNVLYRVALEGKDARLPEQIIAKCFDETQVTFFSACYRRERGVLQILREADAPVPRVYGGHLGSRMAVLFMEDVGTNDLASALQALPPDDHTARMDLLRRGLEALVIMRANVMPFMPRLEREISKIVKEVLTPEYYVNSTTIALNRILALARRKLSATDRGQLAVSLRPLVTTLLDEPKTFIHFEYIPGNLQLTDRGVVAVDFEQSTLGPSCVDLATLLYSPEANLNDEEIIALVDFYHDLLPSAIASSLTVRPEILETTAIMKLLFYAGSAANFLRKYEDSSRLDAMDWYLRAAERLLRRHPSYLDLAEILYACHDPVRR